MRYLERQILLQIIDNRWREHLYEMDYLREGIHLRGFAQIDPLVAYKNEGYSMFSELMNSIWEEFARIVFHVEVNVEPAQAEEMFAAERRGRGREMQYAGGGPEQPSAMQQAASAPAAIPGVTPGVHPSTPAGGDSGVGAAEPATATGAAAQAAGTVVKSDREKLGRNDPCWCGSGKKYKKCHGA
jgi:preprotein translocase subunit SecA